jgi:hypothetical protein
MYTFGDIVTIDMKFTNQQWSKIRPVMIFSHDKNDYTFMYITTKKPSIDTNSITVPVNSSNNLKLLSYIKITKYATYTKHLIRKKVWSLSDSSKTALKKKLVEYINSL